MTEASREHIIYTISLQAFLYFSWLIRSVRPPAWFKWVFYGAHKKHTQKRMNAHADWSQKIRGKCAGTIVTFLSENPPKIIKNMGAVYDLPA